MEIRTRAEITNSTNNTEPEETGRIENGARDPEFSLWVIRRTRRENILFPPFVETNKKRDTIG